MLAFLQFVPFFVLQVFIVLGRKGSVVTDNIVQANA
jgi:hypothetical protein